MIADEASALEYVATVVDPEGLERCKRLIELLRHENEVQNLVSRESISEVWKRHIADSIQLLRFVPRGTSTWLDLGTGAGFPGLAVAIARPDTSVTLVESRRRRCEWLAAAADDLGLENVLVAHARLEVIPDRRFDVISARAFAPMDRLIPLATRFSTSATHWVLPKGRSARQELASLPPKVARMFHVEQSLTDPEAGILVGTGKPELRK